MANNDFTVEKSYAEILVYDKEGNLIGTFDNQGIAETDDARKNLLVSPIVKTVLNGESTLTFSILRSSKKWQNLKHPENEWHCNGRIYTMMNTNSVIYSGEVVNVTLYESWYLLARQFGQVHNVDTDVEALDYHTVKVLPRTSQSFKLTVNGVEYNDSEVMDSRGVLLPRGSGGYALWAILKANTQGWRLGVCDVIVDGFDVENDFGTFNLETDMKSLLDNISSIRSLWGGVLIWDSQNKILHYRDETKEGSDFNTYKGFSISRGKNMLEEPTLTVDNEIITKAYILGNGNIHIKEVNDGKEYLEDYSYTTEVYEGYLQNPNIHYTGSNSLSGQTQLKHWGERVIKEKSRPRESYTISLVDRSMEQAYSHDTFVIGDITRVFIKNPITDLEEEKDMRITEHSYNVWLRSSDSTVIAGDKIQNSVEIFKHIYDNAIKDNPKFDDNGDFNGDNVMVGSTNAQGQYTRTSITETANNQYALIELNSQYISETVSSIANLKIYADSTFATIEAFAEFQTATSSAIAGLQIYADSTFATINSFTQFQTATANNFTQIEQYVDSEVSSVSISVGRLGDDLDDLDDDVASISLQMDKYGNSIAEINADVTNINGQLNAVSASIGSLNADVLSLEGIIVGARATNFVQSISAYDLNVVTSIDFENQTYNRTSIQNIRSWSTARADFLNLEY